MSYVLVIFLCAFFPIVLGFMIDDYCEKNNYNEFLEFLVCLLIALGVLSMIAFIFIHFLVQFLYSPFPIPEVQNCFCNCDCCRK